MNDLQGAWNRLETESVAEPGTRRVRIHGETNHNVYAVLEPPQIVGIQLEVAAASVPVIAGYPSSGAFRTRVERVGEVSRITVALERSDLRDIFAEMCGDLLNACLGAKDQASAVRRLVERLSAWKEMLSQGGPKALTVAEQVGLWGELRFVEMLFKAGVEPASVLLGWRGPLREAQDFRFPGLAIEVKTTAEPPLDELRIASLEQLDWRSTGRLMLWHYAVAGVEAGAGFTLPEVVGSIRAMPMLTDETRVLLESLMRQAGYFSAHASSYLLAWQLVSGSGFEIGDNFPSLTAANVPAAVTKASYGISPTALVGRPQVGQDDVVSAVRASVEWAVAPENRST